MFENAKKSENNRKVSGLAITDKVWSVMRTVSHGCAHSKTFMQLPVQNILF
jgi:hypothetical protein